MKQFSRVIAAVAALVLLSVPLLAQRQTPGRPSIDAYGVFAPFKASADSTAFVFGGGLAWCNYNYGGRTTIGLDVFQEPRLFVEEAVYTRDGDLVAPEERHDLRTWDVCASGGYLFRLWAPRSRVFILSAGATLLAGVSYCKPMAEFVKDSGKNYSAVGVYIGIVPELQAEVFPFRNVSFYATVRPRMTVLNGLGGKSDWFRPTFGAGVKFYL